jgi:hypothetical protein
MGSKESVELIDTFHDTANQRTCEVRDRLGNDEILANPIEDSIVRTTGLRRVRVEIDRVKHLQRDLSTAMPASARR